MKGKFRVFHTSLCLLDNEEAAKGKRDIMTGILEHVIMTDHFCWLAGGGK